MNRRNAIRNVALLVGGTFSAPTIMALGHWENNLIPKVSYPNFTLSDNQKLIIEEVAEIIIPKTNTHGAKDTGVPAFVVMMIQDCYRAPEHVSFAEGLTDLESKKFLSLNPAQKIEMLKQVEQNSVEQMKIYQV